MDVVRGPNSTTCSVRLQPQNTEDESRDMTQTGKMKSNECSLRSGCAGVVKVSEFSSFCKQPEGQITMQRDNLQHF